MLIFSSSDSEGNSLKPRKRGFESQLGLWFIMRHLNLPGCCSSFSDEFRLNYLERSFTL